MTYATIAGRFRPAAAVAARAYDAAAVAGGSLLIAACAQVAAWLPLSPVPVTAQTFGVLVVGMLLGSRRGAMAAALYLLEGACGLPVFAGGAGGIAWLAGPTGGYLVGFVAAAWLTGRLAERGWDRRAASTAAAMALGDAALLLPGAVWLSAFVGPGAALYGGLAVFLPGEAFKIALAAAVMPAAWRLLPARPEPPGSPSDAL